MWLFKTSKASAPVAMSSDGGVCPGSDAVEEQRGQAADGFSVSPGETSEAVAKRPAVRRWLEHVGHWLEIVWRHPIITVGLVVMVSGTSLATLDVTDYYFSSDNFCANTCHAMKTTVAKELQESKHWKTPTGVRPTCANCHVSGRLTLAMWDHIVGTRDLVAQITNDIQTAEDFEKLRPGAAEKARLQMLESDSKTCRRCHVFEAIQPQRNRGKRQHAEGLKTGATCIECHYNLVHKAVEPSDKFLKAIDDKYKNKK